MVSSLKQTLVSAGPAGLLVQWAACNFRKLGAAGVLLLRQIIGTSGFFRITPLFGNLQSR